MQVNVASDQDSPMSRLALARALGVALLLIGLGTVVSFSTFPTRPSPYTFELVDREIKKGFGTTVLVRLIETRTQALVPGATMLVSRLDMSPDGMGQMNALLDLVPDTPDGYFRFETGLTMRGGWALTLVARVPGAADVVRSRLMLQAVS
jgi:hypothetical protein